ncbi:MAG: ABC transporter ATP-binding protein [Clostridia bacterium]|nr:ABC transporter ATP-binding protein [Clostridia bacterium]
MSNLLEVKNLTKRYGAITALDNVNIKIAGGKIIGLLGPNGSGKTTFLKCVAGLLTVDGGEILVDGIPVGSETKKSVSFLPERTYLDPSRTVRETIDFFKTFYEDFDERNAYSLLSSLGVDPAARLSALSKGTKEKVQLVLVMARRAKLFLLDEPLGGVDPAAREFILNTILAKYREGSTIIVSTHLILDVEEILDEYIMVNGNTFSAYGSVKALHEKGKTLDGLFREEFRCY